MANPEHLKILNWGIEAWNQWRREHSEVRPDLSGADLGFTGLTDADLSFGNLISASLEEASLISANLSEAKP